MLQALDNLQHTLHQLLLLLLLLLLPLLYLLLPSGDLLLLLLSRRRLASRCNSLIRLRHSRLHQLWLLWLLLLAVCSILLLLWLLRRSPCLLLTLLLLLLLLWFLSNCFLACYWLLVLFTTWQARNIIMFHIIGPDHVEATFTMCIDKVSWKRQYVGGVLTQMLSGEVPSPVLLLMQHLKI